MPDFQRIAHLLIHSSGQHRILLPAGRQRQPDLFFTAALDGCIPCDSLVTPVPLQNHDIVILIDTLSSAVLKLFVKGKVPKGGFGNTPFRHQSESAMERGKRHAQLLKHIAEGPIRIGLIHIPQPGQLMCHKRRVQIGVMNHSLWSVGGIALRNVNRQPAVFRKAVDNVPGGSKIGKPGLRIHQL